MGSKLFDVSDADERFAGLLLDSDAENSDGDMDDSQAGALVLCPSDNSDSDSDCSNSQAGTLVLCTSDDSDFDSDSDSSRDSEGWASDTEAGGTWIVSDSHGPNDRVLMCVKPIDFYKCF